MNQRCERCRAILVPDKTFRRTAYDPKSNSFYQSLACCENCELFSNTPAAWLNLALALGYNGRDKWVYPKQDWVALRRAFRVKWSGMDVHIRVYRRVEDGLALAIDLQGFLFSWTPRNGWERLPHYQSNQIIKEHFPQCQK